MKYAILKIHYVQPAWQEMENLLANAIETAGIWLKDDEWHFYFDHDIFEQKKEKIIQIIGDLLRTPFDYSVEYMEDDEIDWNEEWKKSYHPVHISDQLVIYPSWYEVLPEDQGKIVVKIDPQMGFGTGTHETTQLMLRFIEKYLPSQGKILDMGTGSGILAITAAKIHPKLEIDAVEVDKDSLDNALLNASINKVSSVQWILGGKEKIPAKQYHAILANINRSVLLDLMEIFHKKLHDHGLCILSGILEEEKHHIDRLCSNLGWTLHEEQKQNDWIGQVWIKLP